MTKRKTNLEFLKELKVLGGGEYVALEKYSLSKTPILIKHTTCGTVYRVIPNNFIKGKRCPKCSRVTTPQKFYKKFCESNKNPYISLDSTFYDYDTPVIVYCSLHNLRSSLMPTSILRGNYLCKYCRRDATIRSQVKTEEDFKKDLYAKHGDSISIVDHYKNTHTKIRFKCNLCGATFKAEPNSVIRLSGCPVCAQSHGELEVSKYLNEHHISYVSQKTFSGCVYRRKLPFDFYLPEYNTLIEFDGEQHHKAVKLFGGEVALKYQVVRDHIKDSFAKSNSINLIRINSIDEITKVLDKQLKESKAESHQPKLMIKR